MQETASEKRWPRWLEAGAKGQQRAEHITWSIRVPEERGKRREKEEVCLLRVNELRVCSQRDRTRTEEHTATALATEQAGLDRTGTYCKAERAEKTVSGHQRANASGCRHGKSGSSRLPCIGVPPLP